MNLKFLIMDTGLQERPKNRVVPIVLSVPEEVVTIEDGVSKRIAKMVARMNIPGAPEPNFVLSQTDAEKSLEIGRMFDFVPWDNVPHLWLDVPKNFNEAYEYVKIVGVPTPSVEHLISEDTLASYRYSMDILNAPFPLGEPAIARDITKSIGYARRFGCRIRSAEDEISRDDYLAGRYCEIMKENKLWNSWTPEELERNPLWMYQYAKDFIGGRLPDTLHNAMHLSSFSNPSNKWIKKYFGHKKYSLKKGYGEQ